MARDRHAQGYSLLETLFALGIAATCGAVAIPQLTAGLDEHRTLGAARSVAARLQRTRLLAVSSQRTTAVRFRRDAAGWGFRTYADGNGDGVRSADIDTGIDLPVYATERLSNDFQGVEFGTLPGLPAVDASSVAPGSDPIKCGSSDAISFTSLGTATPGSLYVLGPRGIQYVIRVLGETGRTRLLKFNPLTRQWKAL